MLLRHGTLFLLRQLAVLVVAHLVEEMLGGKRPDIPWGKGPFAKAPTEKEKAEQEALL